MFLIGLIFILGGIINLVSAKNKSYLGWNWWIWTKLYGETFTQRVFYLQGIALIIIGGLIIAGT